MEPISIILLLLVATVILVAAEAFLPTHGVLGVAGSACAIGAVVLAFGQHRWAGAGLLVGLLIASPFVFTLLVKVWERSPVGKRVTLTATTAPIEHEPVHIGDIGRTLSELRPMGEAEFGPVSVQVTAHGARSIAAGASVRVIAYRDGIATVEPLES